VFNFQLVNIYLGYFNNTDVIDNIQDASSSGCRFICTKINYEDIMHNIFLKRIIHHIMYVIYDRSTTKD
jgi:hypothetical protein